MSCAHCNRSLKFRDAADAATLCKLKETNTCSRPCHEAIVFHPEVQFDARRLYEESARGVQRCIPWTATYTPPPYDATNPAHQPLPPLPSREELYALALAHTHAVRTGQEKD
jgi:hypothetical protein